LPDLVFRDGLEDVQAIQVSANALGVGEAASGTFGVRLVLAPAGSVNVDIASADAGAATVSPPSLTFTSGDFASFKLVTVGGVGDSDCGDEAVGVLLTSAGLTDQVVDATVADDDPQGIQLSTGELTVSEGSQNGFTVRLDCEPGPTYDVALESADTQAVTVAPASLSFNPTDYATPKSATVSGVEDADQDDEMVGVTASASAAPTQTLTVAVSDNDVPDVTPPFTPAFTSTRFAARRTRTSVAWTMPGDDGTSGTVASYALVQRVCSPGVSCTIASDVEFDAAAAVPGAPPITPGGTAMTLDVDIPLEKTITFALRALDDAGNPSTIVSASTSTQFLDDTLAGPAGETEYGISVAAANVDGDALSDVLVGRTQASTSGAIRVLYGNGRAATDVLATQLGLSGSARMGLSIAGAGDVDGDTFEDVIVGAPNVTNAACTNGTGPQTGNAFLFFGGPNGLRSGATPTLCTTGGSVDCYVMLSPPAALSADQVCSYGASVAGVGNLGGTSQTRSMVVVGAGDRTASSMRIGKAFVYSVTGSRPDITVSLVASVVGGAQDFHFGNAVCAARDVSGDDVPDLVVTAHRRGQVSPVAGRAYLFLGGSVFASSGATITIVADGSATTDGVVPLSQAAPVVNDSFGNACRAAGDLDGDGFADLVVSTSGGAQAGFTVFKGRAGLDAMPPAGGDRVTITGLGTNTEFGAGHDVDGDGRPDVIVGDSTAIFLYAGSTTATVDPAPIASFTGLAAIASGYPVALGANWRNNGAGEAPLPDIVIGRGAGPAVVVKY
jgi:hypothetical protein